MMMIFFQGIYWDSIDSFEKIQITPLLRYSISFHQETDNISKSKYYLEIKR